MDEQFNRFFSSIVNNDRSRNIIIAAGTTFALLSAWIINDKRRWLSFDTGGSPPTWYGYGRMTILRIVRFFSGGRLEHHFPLSAEGKRYLRESIPPRQGPRPKTREWTLPQRQEQVPLDPEVHARIHSWTEKYAKANPDALDYRLSVAEGSSAMGVFVKDGLPTKNPEANDKIIGTEIFHAHPEDSSLHVWLSEPDLKKVVSGGWGERFPASAIGLTAPGFGFVYAPRTMAECDIVEEIIQAGIEFVTGQKPN